MLGAPVLAEDHVEARYVAWASVDGAAAFAGVRLEMAPGWHVYWRHPGPAGLATDVEVEPPSGWRVGDLLWPVPERFVQPGDIPAFGYEGDVVLVRQLAADAGPIGGTATVAASWLACEDVCVLGEQRVTGRIPDRGERVGLSTEEVAAWRESLPRSVEEAPFRASATGSLDDGLVVWLQWTTEPRAVELFPIPGDGARIDEVMVRTRGGLTRIDVDARVLRGEPQGLQAVVVADAGDGARRGWTLWAGRNKAAPGPQPNDTEHGGTR